MSDANAIYANIMAQLEQEKNNQNPTPIDTPILDTPILDTTIIDTPSIDTSIIDMETLEIPIEKRLGEVFVIFQSVVANMQVYKFQTTNFSRYETTSKMIKQLEEHIFQFIQIAQGAFQCRIVISSDTSVDNNTIYLQNQDDESINTLLRTFYNWLIEGIPTYINQQPALLSYIHQIQNDVNMLLFYMSYRV